MKKKLLIALALSSVPAVSMAEVTGNVGWVSEYLFRGIYQEDSSASAGVDWAGDSGAYVGTWWADVGTGLETDLYFGWGGGDEDGFNYSIGYTGYFYTDDFDDTYNEININLGYGIFALELSPGKWDGFGTSQDYLFSAITISPEKGPYYKIGNFSQDFDGTYYEIGYGYDFMGVDLSVALTYSDDLLVTNYFGDGDTGDYALVFGISKTLGGD